MGGDLVAQQGKDGAQDGGRTRLSRLLPFGKGDRFSPGEVPLCQAACEGLAVPVQGGHGAECGDQVLDLPWLDLAWSRIAAPFMIEWRPKGSPARVWPSSPAIVRSAARQSGPASHALLCGPPAIAAAHTTHRAACWRSRLRVRCSRHGEPGAVAVLVGICRRSPRQVRHTHQLCSVGWLAAGVVDTGVVMRADDYGACRVDAWHPWGGVAGGAGDLPGPAGHVRSFLDRGGWG